MSDPGDEEEERPTALEKGAVNVANPESVRQARRRGKRDDDKRALFWKAVFNDPVGRAEMWAILESGHAFDERFATGPTGFPQPEATWVEAGEQRLSFRLFLSWMKLAPDGVQQMIAEHHSAFEKPKRKKT